MSSIPTAPYTLSPSTTAPATSIAVWMPPNLGGHGRWEASFIHQCNQINTFALRCTSGSVDAPAASCGPDAVIMTLAENDRSLTATSSIVVNSTTTAMSANCAKDTAGDLTCVEAYTTHSHKASKTTSSTTETIDAGDAFASPGFYSLNITGGQEAIVNTKHACKALERKKGDAVSLGVGLTAGLALTTLVFAIVL